MIQILIILSLIGCCIEVDISVPGFPAMADAFAVSEKVIQRTLSFNFLGFCLASVFWGPLSEVWGRRKALLTGQLLFALSGIACALTHSIDALILYRFFQGFGASAMSTICIALVADLYQGEKLMRFNGMLNSTLTASMAAAPIAGGLLTEWLGWRSNYTSVALISGATFFLLFAFLPETLKEKRRFQPSTYLTLIKSAPFMRDALIPSLSVAGYLSFLGCGAFLYIDKMGLSPSFYALYQGAIVATYSLVSYFSGRIGEKCALLAGAFFILTGSLSIAALYYFDILEPLSLTTAMCLYSIGSALIYTPIFSKSMEHFPDIKGYSSSFVMFLRMLLLALALGVAANLYDGTLLAVTALTSAATLLILPLLLQTCVLGWRRKRTGALCLSTKPPIG